MSTAIEQCREGFAALSAYFEDMAQYVSDGVELPDPYLLYDGLNFEEILTYLRLNTNSAADFSIGAGIEGINHFVAVERELAMTETGKTSIYISAISEAQREADFLAQNAVFLPGVMSGAPTSGSQC